MELVKVTQVPKITESMDLISNQIKEKVALIIDMDVNEDNYKEVKNVIADLRKDKKAYEDARKEVKNLVLQPYNDFESSYREKILKVITDCENKLNNKKNEVENKLKQDRLNEVLEYFNQSNQYDFISFDSTDIKVGLTGTIASFKKKIDQFILKTNMDIELIKLQEYSSEVMIEYKKSLDVSNAIITVKEQKEEIARMKEVIEDSKVSIDEFNDAIEEVKEASKVDAQKFVETIVHEKLPVFNVTTTFEVTGTFEQLNSIRSYIKELGVEYNEFN